MIEINQWTKSYYIIGTCYTRNQWGVGTRKSIYNSSEATKQKVRLQGQCY